MGALSCQDQLLSDRVRSTLNSLLKLGFARQGVHPTTVAALAGMGITVADLRALIRTGLPRVVDNSGTVLREASAIAFEVGEFEDGRVELTLAVDLIP